MRERRKLLWLSLMTSRNPPASTRRMDSSDNFFFFQAEDGIRDLTVTGVQTCALPILIPAARSSIYGAMVLAGRILLEPIQKVFINVPQDFMGSAIGEIQSRRGVIDDISQEGEITVIHAKAPVAEMFGFASAVRSATQGRALSSTENAGLEAVPSNLQGEVVRSIRTRKGLPPEPYDAAYYAS